jgi:hypothetical protein
VNKFLALICFITLTSNAFSESLLKKIKWKLHSDEDGIEIYTPVDYKHPSGLVPIKFKTIINHDISKVVTVLADNDRKTQWLPYLEDSRTIVDLSSSEAIVYYRYGSPWPFSPRDFLIQSSAVFNEQTKVLKVEMKSIKNYEGVKKNSDYVRGFSHDGYAVVSVKGKGKTEMEMAFLNDFGGMIPTFVINVVQKKWPYEFIKNLRKQLDKKDVAVNPKFIVK